LLQLRKPFVCEQLFGATRTDSRIRQFYISGRNVPDGMQSSSGPGVHTLQFFRVKPNTAAAAIADVDSHITGALLAQRTFTSGTYHKSPIIRIAIVLSLK